MSDPDAETAAGPAVPTEQIPVGELTGPTRPDSLAWSQESADVDDLEPYTEDIYGSDTDTAGVEAAAGPGTRAERWGGLPLLAFAVAAVAALLAVGFAAVGLTSASHPGHSSQPTTRPSASSPAPPPPPPKVT